MEPKMDAYFSLKELDAHLQQAKGTAFKLFKRHLPVLREGHDFIVLFGDEHAETINELKQQKRIYRQSRNVVMLSSGCFGQLAQAWKSHLD